MPPHDSTTEDDRVGLLRGVVQKNPNFSAELLRRYRTRVKSDKILESKDIIPSFYTIPSTYTVSVASLQIEVQVANLTRYAIIV